MDDEVTPAKDLRFEGFCNLLEMLHRKKKQRSEQDKILAAYINDFKVTAAQTVGKKNSSIYPMLRLLLPNLERERSAYNLKEAKLGALLVKVLSLNKNSPDAKNLLNFRSVSNAPESDFAGVACKILKSRLRSASDAFNIGEINEILDTIASSVENKGTILDNEFSHVIKEVSVVQLKWFLRIILKDLKLGMGNDRILALFHPDAPEYQKQCGNLSKVCDELGDGDTRSSDLGIQLFFAVSPMRCERFDIKNQLPADKTYQIENKFDGERFQMHMENGVFEYFSRKGYSYSSKYGKTYDSGLLTPHLKDVFDTNLTSFILDGEMMGWHKTKQCLGSKANMDLEKVLEKTLEKELTNKFLSGQMSFAEYSNEWYNFDDEDDSVDEVNKINENELPQSSQITEKGIQRRRSKLTRLPAGLLGLMGEANLRFVRGDKETAEKMCHEIIKQVPSAPEPYQTLAQIYEHDSEKSLQFSLLAAHLSPPDANEWLRLAAISKQNNDVKQEMMCYTQAIKDEPHNIDIHMKRLELLNTLEKDNYPTQALKVSRVKFYHKIVTSLPASEGETIMKYTKLAATLYHNNNEIEHALEVMTAAYKKCPTLFTLENINIFLELLMSQKQFQTCIEIFVSNGGVDIEAEIQTVKNSDGEIEEQTNYINCSIPNVLPIDLKSKLIVCFIHLGAVNLVQTLLNNFLTNDVEKAGDLYMDIEEALSSMGYHELAIQLLEPLVKNSSFDLGAVWLKHAECLFSLGREEDAINSYYKVLKHVPQHPDARRKLFAILEKNGRIDEALDMLQQNFKHVVSASLLYEQCCALKKYNKLSKYLEAGEALLSKTFVKYRHQEEINLACRMKCTIDDIYNFRSIRGENKYHEKDIHFDEDETFKLSPQQEWDFFIELLNIASNLKQYFTMQRLSFGALMSKNLSSHRLDIEFYCFQACLLSNDHHNAFRFIREFSQKYPGPRCWNLLNLVINYVEKNTHSKFLLRMFQKDSSNIIKNLFLGNNFLVSGRYLVALKYYLEYHEKCRDPLSALLVAVTILFMAAQRTMDKHHNLILQGMAYMQTYQNLRKCDQEVNYNMGRVYQMLNINNLAIEYYERALACGHISYCDTHGTIDLTKETAYNLYVLYKDHSPLMARKYMLKYLII